MNVCRCNDIDHLIGAEASAYERSHLRELIRDLVQWRALYACPVTGRLWLETFPHGERQGGGGADLVQVSREVARQTFNLPDDYFEKSPEGPNVGG